MIDSMIKDNEIQFLSLKYFEDFSYRQVDIHVKNYQNNPIWEKLEIDHDTAFVDAFRAMPTLNVICNLKNDDQCIRSIYKKAAAKYKDIKAGFTVEFFIFDEMKIKVLPYDVQVELKSYEIDINSPNSDLNKSTSCEAILDSSDVYSNIRAEIAQNLINAGIDIDNYCHGDALCQSRIKVSGISINKIADVFFIAKHIIRQTVASYGKTMTFMARPSELGMSKLTLSLSLKDYHKQLETLKENVLKNYKLLLPFSNPTTNGFLLWDLVQEEREPISTDTKSGIMELCFLDNLTNMYYSIPALLAVIFENKKLPSKKATKNNEEDNDNGYDHAAYSRNNDSDMESIIYDAMESDILTQAFGAEILAEYLYHVGAQVGVSKVTVHPIELKLYYDAI